MQQFSEIFKQHSFESIKKAIESATEADVRAALANAEESTKPISLSNLAALLSPAATSSLEPMAQLARKLTRQRFGNTIQMFIPLYLSNECQNICTYCGFSMGNKIPRLTLSRIQFENEISKLKAWGFDHILLVSGESSRVGIDYFLEMVQVAKKHFSHVSIEVQPLSLEEYKQLVDVGLDSVLVYQETYNETAYARYHPKGKKRNFYNRLLAPEDIAQAGIEKIGLGSLIGLSDWRVDAWFTGLHLKFMREKYWRSRYSIAFPRLQPAEGVDDPEVLTSEKDLAQLICAYRLFDQNIDLSLSTRESENFRNKAIHFGVTTLSAGSKTDPGGYTQEDDALEQFETSDQRSPSAVSQMLIEAGLEPVWKDWDRSISSNNLANQS